MPRLVGETVELVTGTRYSDYGAVIGEETEPYQAVVVPSGRSTSPDEMNFTAVDSVTLLFLEHQEFEVGARFKVRGETFTVDQPTFDHVSAFGTTRGGTEVHLVRGEVAA